MKSIYTLPKSKIHGAEMGPFWGRQHPGGPHAGPRDLLSGGDVPRAALSGRPGAGQQITRVLLP